MGINDWPSEEGTDSEWQLDASYRLHNVTWETQERGDIIVKVLMSDFESIKDIGKEYIDRASSVYKNLAYIIIGNAGMDDHGIRIGKNDAFFPFL